MPDRPPPAFQVYARDELADERLRLMNLEQCGLKYLSELHCWNEGSIPADPEILARLIGINAKRLSKLWAPVSAYYVPSPSDPTRLIHPGLEQEREKQARFKAEMSEAGKRGAKLRWQKPVDSQANGYPNGQATDRPKASDSFASASASEFAFASSPQTPRNAGESGRDGFDLSHWVERLYRRHPKKKAKPLVEQECLRILDQSADPVIAFTAIDRAHTAWSASEDWQKENGRYCPQLATWLADEGYTVLPHGAISSESVRPREETEDERKVREAALREQIRLARQAKEPPAA